MEWTRRNQSLTLNFFGGKTNGKIFQYWWFWKPKYLWKIGLEMAWTSWWNKVHKFWWIHSSWTMFLNWRTDRGFYKFRCISWCFMMINEEQKSRELNPCFLAFHRKTAVLYEIPLSFFSVWLCTGFLVIWELPPAYITLASTGCLNLLGGTGQLVPGHSKMPLNERGWLPLPWNIQQD